MAHNHDLSDGQQPPGAGCEACDEYYDDRLTRELTDWAEVNVNGDGDIRVGEMLLDAANRIAHLGQEVRFVREQLELHAPTETFPDIDREIPF